MEKKRILYLDIIRIIACFLVIVNHTNSTIFLTRQPSPTWFVSVAYFFVSKPAVPLFLMVSGAVLLGKEESYRKCFKRFFRAVVVFFAFSFFYYYFFNNSISALSLSGVLTFLSDILKSPVVGSFWYLYLYMGLLLMLPLLRKLIRTFERKDYLYLFGLSILLWGSAPLLRRYIPFFDLNAHFFDAFLGIFVCLFIAGYFCDRYVETRISHLPVFAVLTAALLIIQVVGTYHIYLENPESYLAFDSATLVTITLSSICVFLTVRHIAGKLTLSDRVAHAVTTVATCTFGIYLFSSFFIGKLSFISSYLNLFLHPLIAIVIYEGIVFFVGFVITYFLRKIPVVAKFL